MSFENVVRGIVLVLAAMGIKRVFSLCQTASSSTMWKGTKGDVSAAMRRTVEAVRIGVTGKIGHHAKLCVLSRKQTDCVPSFHKRKRRITDHTIDAHYAMHESPIMCIMCDMVRKFLQGWKGSYSIVLHILSIINLTIKTSKISNNK